MAKRIKFEYFNDSSHLPIDKITPTLRNFNHNRVTNLKTEIGTHLAIPFPGYWTLEDCASMILPTVGQCLTDKAIVIPLTQSNSCDTLAMLEGRNYHLHSMLTSFRNMAITSVGRLSPMNMARYMQEEPIFMLKEPHLQNLALVQKVRIHY